MGSGYVGDETLTSYRADDDAGILIHLCKAELEGQQTAVSRAGKSDRNDMSLNLKNVNVCNKLTNKVSDVLFPKKYLVTKLKLKIYQTLGKM